MKKTKNLIIGAGISGLSFANFCNDDFLIVEKEKEAGGLCRTFYENEYVWDYSGHFFHFADERIKKFFDSKIPRNEFVTCKKNTKIYYHDRLIDYPFQMNIHELEKEEFIDCLYDLFHRGIKDSYSDFLSMLYGKFGASITEKFLRPYNEKLYACNLSDLDVNAMGRFFPYAEPQQIINNMKIQENSSYNSNFEYPKRGAIAFVNALLDGIDKNQILYSKKLDSVNADRHIAIVGGEEIFYENLINTIPFDSFLESMGSSFEEFKGESANEKCLHANKVLVFNLGFDKKSKYDNIHWIYFPDKGINFYRVGFYDNILGTDKLSVYVEIGFKTDSDIDIDAELVRTIDNLKKVGIISNHQLQSYNSVIISPAYVHITQESKEFMNAKLKSFKTKDIYSIGRYGKWTYCSIEDCVKDAMNLVKVLKK